LQQATISTLSALMVSGLTGTSNSHSHFLRELALLARKSALVRAHNSGDFSSPETVPDEPAVAADTEGKGPSADDNSEMITKLEARNTEVLTHEAAHMAAAGAYAKGGASYTYQIGPDGKAYAIGGEVSVDMTPVPGNPRATITKMMAIRAAALSPADPSGQDISVASAAAQIEAQARAQLSQEVTQNLAPAMRTAAGRYAQPAASAGTVVNAAA
jgi:hypothetical protein